MIHTYKSIIGTYQEKSHVFNHFELRQLDFVHGLPYTSGLKCWKFQIAMMMKTAAICSRTRLLSVDVTMSKTAHERRIAK